MPFSRKHQVATNEHDTCAILDDTTFQKSGIRIEGVSKVFDHVTHSFIYGMKCLTLALSDGKSCYPIDFSLHREKGKKKDYGLTLKQRKEQFKEKRNAKNPDYARKAECDESKLEMARRMLCHAVEHGINFKPAARDSWFRCDSLIERQSANAILWFSALYWFGQDEPQVALSDKQVQTSPKHP